MKAYGARARSAGSGYAVPTSVTPRSKHEERQVDSKQRRADKKRARRVAKQESQIR